MAENLSEQLAKLKTTLAKWTDVLAGFKQWAISNDGVLDAAENAQISRLQTEISSINQRIAQIEKAKAGENSNNNQTTNNQSPQNEQNNEASKKAAEIGAEMEKMQCYQRGYAGPDGYWLPPDFKTKIAAGQKIPNGDSVTWCNRFALDLADKVMGANNPFKKLISQKGMGNIGAGTMKEFMEAENGKSFDEITELEKAWEHINAGKMVFFSTKDHVATGVPTTTMKELNIKGKIYRFGQAVQAGASIGTMYLDKAWGTRIPEVKIFICKTPDAASNGQTSQNQNTQPETNNSTQNNNTQASTSISDSVGKGGANKEKDVTRVQELLNTKNNAALTVDGDCGKKTIAAIEAFQQKTFGWKDGLISAGGKTWTALNGGAVSNNNSSTNNNTTNNSSGTNNNTTNNSNNTAPNVDGSTGIGDEGDESYKNQRDNPVLGDVTCNVTTLTMQLVGLANGDEARVVQSALALCQKHKVAGVSASVQLEEILRKLTIVAAGSEYLSGTPAWQYSWVLDKTAEMFTDLVDHVDNADKLMDITSKEKYNQKIVPALKEGAEVMVSNKLTSGGHIVFLVSVRDEGIVINDPYGIMVTGHQYLRNAELINSTKKSLISNNQAVFDNRLKLNSGLKSKIIQLLASGGNFPTNSGEKNFYTWDEVKTYQIGKWCNVAYKKK